METKDITKTIKHLKNYQDWRRGNIEQMPKPKEVGNTIDNAILILEQSKQMQQRIKELEDEIQSLKENPICNHCGKYKYLQGNGFLHQLCECNLTNLKTISSENYGDDGVGLSNTEITALNNKQK